MKKLIVVLSITLLCIAIVTGCSGRKSSSSSSVVEGDISTHPKVTLKLGGIEAAEDFFTLAAYKFADMVKERSKGSITVEVYPASQLGDMPKMFEAVKMGTQDIVGGSGSYMSQFIPDKAIETAFFLFEDEAHFLKYVASDLCKQYSEEFTKKTSVIPLSQTWIRGPRFFIAKKPLRTAADFKDLKTRVPDIKGYLKSVEALGCKPTMIVWGELYLALLQNVVEAGENAPFALYAAKFHEAAPFLIETVHLYDSACLYMSERSFNKLTPAQKKVVIEADLEAAQYYNKSVRDMTQDCIDKMIAEGTTFIRKSEIDIATLSKMAKDGAMALEAEGFWSKGLYDKVAAMK